MLTGGGVTLRSWRVEDVSPPVPSAGINFVYDFGMRDDELSEDLSEDQIRAWADEAATGYDVEALKRRGRGRPGRGAEPMQVVAVRLSADEIEALDAIATRDQVSRSEAIRRALAKFAA